MPYTLGKRREVCQGIGKGATLESTFGAAVVAVAKDCGEAGIARGLDSPRGLRWSPYCKVANAPPEETNIIDAMKTNS